MILLPLQKDKEAARAERELAKNRSNLIAAARNGDEDAMESLTMEDMDTYSMISQRIVREDIFSIVDSYFMPYGIECDQYNVMGEILDFMEFKNILTGEEIYQLTLDSNDVQFDVCINQRTCWVSRRQGVDLRESYGSQTFIFKLYLYFL